MKKQKYRFFCPQVLLPSGSKGIMEKWKNGHGEITARDGEITVRDGEPRSLR